MIKSKYQLTEEDKKEILKNLIENVNVRTISKKLNMDYQQLNYFIKKSKYFSYFTQNEQNRQKRGFKMEQSPLCLIRVKKINKKPKYLDNLKQIKIKNNEALENSQKIANLIKHKKNTIFSNRFIKFMTREKYELFLKLLEQKKLVWEICLIMNMNIKNYYCLQSLIKNHNKDLIKFFLNNDRIEEEVLILYKNNESNKTIKELTGLTNYTINRILCETSKIQILRETKT